MVLTSATPTSENIPPSTSNLTVEAVREPCSCEDSEIRSRHGSGDGEDISNVEVNLNELIASKSSYPSAFVFRKSKITAELIKEYEEAGFFPPGDRRPPSDEETPTPEADEVVVFRDFFTCGLRFPCDIQLPAILKKFSVKIHQLTHNSFLELSNFFWVMKTFQCSANSDFFARLFKLIIQRDIIKLDDGNFYEAHYGCCTFNTRRKNANQNLTHIQFDPCSKNNLSGDWQSYWFYVKVDMFKVPDYTGPAYLFYSLMAAVTALALLHSIAEPLASRVTKMVYVFPALFLAVMMSLKNLLQRESGPCHMAGSLQKLFFLMWIGLLKRYHFRDFTCDLTILF
jgi:hypothetical protein